MTTNAYNPRRTAWFLTWNSFNIGQADAVDPSGLKINKDKIQRGTTGPIVLGHFFSGMEGTVKAQVKDLNVAAFIALCPWMTASTNQIIAPSTPNINLYSYAQLLTLHPVDMGTTLTEDLNFVKATPSMPVNMKRDGMKDDLWDIEFEIYPDVSQAQLSTPKWVWAWLGSTTPVDE